LVSAGVIQPIQKIIGIGWLTLADTINEIFGIGWITSADTNNVPGIRGVPPPTRNPNHGEIFFCAIRLPNVGAASLDDAASLGAAASLDALAQSCRCFLAAVHVSLCSCIDPCLVTYGMQWWLGAVVYREIFVVAFYISSLGIKWFEIFFTTAWTRNQPVLVVFHLIHHA
jgi:hypothetical protein